MSIAGLAAPGALRQALQWLRSPGLATAPSRPRLVLLMLLLASVAAALGVAASLAATALAERPAALVGLPAALALAFVFALDRQRLLAGLILTRASLDLSLENTRLDVGGTSFGLGALLNLLIIALTIAFVVQQGPRLLRGTGRYFGPWLLMALLALLHTPVPADAVKFFMTLLTCACVFALGEHLAAQPGGSRGVLKLLAASSALPVLITLVMVALGMSFRSGGDGEPNFSDSEMGRYAGPFSHPNGLAFYTLLNVVLVFMLWRTSKSQAVLARYGLPAYLALLLVVLMLTKTRSAWLAALVFFLLYGLFVERRVLVLLLAGLALSMLLPSVRERVLDLGDGNAYVQSARLNSYAWRQLLWQDALATMNPKSVLLGNGLESFRFRSAEFFSLANGAGFQAHNVFLQMLFETGIGGLLAFAWLLAGPALRLLGAVRAGRKLAMAGVLLLLCYGLICYSDNVLSVLVFNIFFWMSVGALCHEARPAASASPLAGGDA
jgi:O-antigen ligase